MSTTVQTGPSLQSEPRTSIWRVENRLVKPLPAGVQGTQQQTDRTPIQILQYSIWIIQAASNHYARCLLQFIVSLLVMPSLMLYHKTDKEQRCSEWHECMRVCYTLKEMVISISGILKLTFQSYCILKSIDWSMMNVFFLNRILIE